MQQWPCLQSSLAQYIFSEVQNSANTPYGVRVFFCRTCRWHIRNCGTKERANHVTLCNACKINFDQVKLEFVTITQ